VKFIYISPNEPAVIPTPTKKANSSIPCADAGISKIFDFK